MVKRNDHNNLFLLNKLAITRLHWCFVFVTFELLKAIKSKKIDFILNYLFNERNIIPFIIYSNT